MNQLTDHLDHDTLAAHALDALNVDEVIEVGRHLAGCTQCQAELAALRATVALIPFGVPTAEPSPELRERIVARAQATPQGQRPTATATPVVSRASGDRWGWLWRLTPALAVLTLVLGFLLGRTVPLGSPPDLVEHPGARTAALSGTGQGAFVVVPDDGHMRLSVDGLPALDSNKVYQVWLLGESTPISVGTFTVDANGRGELELNGLAWSPDYQGVAITAEEQGGSAGPTSDIVAKADL